MSKKNRIEQPYGYKEQNDFSSSVGMVCEAISGSGSDKDTIKKIIEKLNIIFTKAFVDSQYNISNKEIEFLNYYGAEVDRVKFPYIVDTATYNENEKKIIITFEDDNVEPIEIELSALTSLLDNETRERIDSDNAIWDAIGEIGISGTNLVDMIEQEVSARTSGDNDLYGALNQEISARTEGDATIEDKIDEEKSARVEGDQRLWDAIGEIGASGTNLVDMIEQEVSARTSGDNDLYDALNQEISARTSEDERLWEALNQIGASGMNLTELIQQEASARVESDESIWEELRNEISERETNDLIEISARTDADNSILNSLSEEAVIRAESDNELNGKIDNEKEMRELNDTNILSSLNEEISARTNADSIINERLSQEVLDRAREDGILDGKIDTEKIDRINDFNSLNDKITEEKNSRISSDNSISSSLTIETTNRENEDNLIWDALNAEIANRESSDNDLRSLIGDNGVSIVKVTNTLPSNVKEAYELKNALGEVLGDRINIYKDSSLRDVELVSEHDGRQGQFLKFTYILQDGSEKEEYLDVSTFLVEAEFKDGLIVTDSGKVMIKIDSASENYLSVSPNGLKVTGIDAIAQNLEIESSNRESRDTILQTNITTEITNRQVADSALLDAINTETQERENSFNELNSRILEEKTERTSSDSAISRQIAEEQTTRLNADQTLNRTITQVSSDLSAEVNNRINGDASLQEQINGLKNTDIEIKNNIIIISSGLSNEISARRENDDNLQLQLNKKANSVDVYYKTESDDLFARKDEIPTDFYSKSDVDSKDAAIKALILAEESTRETEDATLNNAITAETSAREAAYQTLQSNIDSLSDEVNTKLVEIKANDLTISVDNENRTKPEIKVNISSDEDQIIKLNGDGLYAKATLDYDEEHNILTFTNTNSSSTIVLKTKSEIDNIYYDKPNERIVIEYTVNGTRKEDVYVPVGDLIEEWRTEDGNVGAIELTKERNTLSEDVLKARLVLNTAHTDNAAIIDDNALYVSKNAIISDLVSEIEDLKTRVLALEQALQNSEQIHESQSERITAVEEKNETQDDSINDLINYVNTTTNP